MLRNKTALVVLFIISNVLFFIGGSATGRYITTNYLLREVKNANAEIELGNYTIYRDIASDINLRKYAAAKCLADLSASSMFDDVKACAANQECKKTLETKIRANAPEVFGEATLKFIYLKSKDGIKSCQ
jgi:hypothetical protein